MRGFYIKHAHLHNHECWLTCCCMITVNNKSTLCSEFPHQMLPVCACGHRDSFVTLLYSYTRPSGVVASTHCPASPTYAGGGGGGGAAFSMAIAFSLAFSSRISIILWRWYPKKRAAQAQQ